MVYFKLSLLALSALVAGSLAEPHYAPTVMTKAGAVRGNVRSFEGKNVFIYEGIRYGEFLLCSLLTSLLT